MIDFIGKSKYWFALSGLLILLSFVSLGLWGLNWGIDFTGGSLMELQIKSTTAVDTNAIANIANELEIKDIRVQPSSDDIYLIRMEAIGEELHQQFLNKIEASFVDPTVEGQIVIEHRFDSIGPVIGAELKSKAFSAIALVLLAIVLYIALVFRKVSYPVASWKYGISAIIALAHDIIIIVGVFSLLGRFADYQVDSLFVTALLTVMGFSVHDTIVTFDRIRENLFHHQELTYKQIVNKSINETVVRSLNTSITTLFVLTAVYLFGGDTIEHFMLALMCGIVIGTFSSIFLASPLLYSWFKLRK
ncbi:MAG: protein translocase subunit SecF [Candidatus Komeilibacteria bacterium]